MVHEMRLMCVMSKKILTSEQITVYQRLFILRLTALNFILNITLKSILKYVTLVLYTIFTVR